MTIEEFDKAMEDIPKIQTNNPISAMNTIDVDELRKTVERFKRIPTFDELQQENNKLLKEKQELIGYLKEEVKKINEMFDGFVPQDYLWQVETKTKLKVYQEILSKIEKSDK